MVIVCLLYSLLLFAINGADLDLEYCRPMALGNAVHMRVGT